MHPLVQVCLSYYALPVPFFPFAPCAPRALPRDLCRAHTDQAARLRAPRAAAHRAACGVTYLPITPTCHARLRTTADDARLLPFLPSADSLTAYNCVTAFSRYVTARTVLPFGMPCTPLSCDSLSTLYSYRCTAGLGRGRLAFLPYSVAPPSHLRTRIADARYCPFVGSVGITRTRHARAAARALMACAVAVPFTLRTLPTHRVRPG